MQKLATYAKWVVLAPVLAVVALILLPPQFGGRITLVAVDGTSMEPTYMDGDLSINWRQADYEVGDSIVYKVDGGQVIHRIIDQNADGTFVTQGDNRDLVDPWTPTAAQVRGRTVAHVDGLGRIVTDVLGRLGVPGIMAVAFVLMILVDAVKKAGRAERSTRITALASLVGLLSMAAAALWLSSAAEGVLPLPNAAASRVALGLGMFSLMMLASAVASILAGPARSASLATDLVYGARIVDVTEMDAGSRTIAVVEDPKRLRKVADDHKLPVLRHVTEDDHVLYAVSTDELLLVHDLRVGAAA